MTIKTARNWWIYVTAALCASPLLSLMPGCKGSFTPRGGPTGPTPIPTTRPTPGPTPLNTPSPAALIGTYVGTLSIPTINENSRRMTMTIGGDGTAAVQATLSSGGVLSLTGTVNQTNNTVTVSGSALVAGGNQPVTFTLTGLLTASQGNFVNGSGTITSTAGDTGTWSARKTG